MSTRILMEDNIERVDDLIGCDRAYLLRIKGFGPKCLARLESALENIGLSIEELSRAPHRIDTMDIPINKLGLSMWALNGLTAKKIYKISDLVGYHRSDLLRFRGFGATSLKQLEEALERVGADVFGPPTPQRVSIRLDSGGISYMKGIPADVSDMICGFMHKEEKIRDAVIGAVKQYLHG